MNGGKEKYANGSSFETSQMTKQEIQQAIEYWCEENQELRKLLLNLYEKDLKTIGCCGGHDEEKNRNHAYIAIQMDKTSNKYIFDLLAKMEESDIQSNVGIIKGDLEKDFCVITANELGKNEKFFCDINKACEELEKGSVILPEIRQKYENLETMFYDERIEQCSYYPQYVLDLGSSNIEVTGLLKYGGYTVNVSNKEMERMAKWLKNNPNSEITPEFYGTKTKRIEYRIDQIKEMAKHSKISIKAIKRAFESIKNEIKGPQNVVQEQLEGGR